MDSASAVKTSTLPIYVHKLKRAWMQIYNDCDDKPKAKKATSFAAGSSDYLAQSMPGNTKVPRPSTVYIYNIKYKLFIRLYL